MMVKMIKCAVKNCKNNSEVCDAETVKFFRFPSNTDRKAMWLNACGWEVKDTRHKGICSEHFTNSDYTLQDQLLNTPLGQRKLKNDAAPSVNVHITVTELTKRLRQRHEVLARKLIVAELINDSIRMEEQKRIEAEEAYHKCRITVDVQTEEVTDFMCAERLHALEKELNELKSKVRQETLENTRLKCAFRKLEGIFTKGQIRKLGIPQNQKVMWSSEDISSANSLHSAGPSTYRYMYYKGYPLPAASTLRSWRQKEPAMERKRAQVKKRQQRVLMILDSKCVKYDVIDIADPGNEEQKKFMQDNSTSPGGTISDPTPRYPLPPQIFNEHSYCGDYDQFDLANEKDEIEQFLKVEVSTVTTTTTQNSNTEVPIVGNGVTAYKTENIETTDAIETTDTKIENVPNVSAVEVEADSHSDDAD